MDPFSSPSKPKTAIKRQPQNFVEALKSIGGHTLKSVGNDVIKGMGADVMNSVFGGTKNPDSNPLAPNLEAEALANAEQAWNERSQREARHREVIETKPIYDRREEEVKAQIKAIQDQLSALAKDLTNLSVSAQKAIHEEMVHPGQYHVSYLEKLRRFIIALRQQVTDANNWLSLSYSRRQAKQHYWGGVAKSGTKFMLSQERYMATSAG